VTEGVLLLHNQKPAPAAASAAATSHGQMGFCFRASRLVWLLIVVDLADRQSSARKL
jgi:hypothetical protein